LRVRALLLRAAAALLAGTLLPGVTACTAAKTGPGWRAAALPVPAGAHPVLGDLVRCPNRWFALGGLRLPDGSTNPAVWSSVDGAQWTVVTVHPVSAYGPQQVFSSGACGGSSLAAVGATSGGVHSNPRISTWYGNENGLFEKPAAFELFGGPDAVALSRIAGGGHGFLIAGDRIGATGLAGAAAWLSPTGEAFTLENTDPALASDARTTTSAADGAAVAGGWILAGSLTRRDAPGSARDPAAWRFDGERWAREDVPSVAGEDEAFGRAVLWTGGRVLAVGVRGTAFGAWVRDSGGGWKAVARFGRFSGTAVPVVTGLAVDGGTAYVAGCDGSAFHLWRSDSWNEVDLPAALGAGAGRRLVVAADGGRLLLGAENGTAARIWLR
jgi:hypothetical protein